MAIFATAEVSQEVARFLVKDGRGAVVVKPVGRSGPRQKLIKVIPQKDTENYATVNVRRISQKGARFSVGDGDGDGSREAGVVVKPVGRGGAMPKIKLILQNDRKYYATPKVSVP